MSRPFVRKVVGKHSSPADKHAVVKRIDKAKRLSSPDKIRSLSGYLGAMMDARRKEKRVFALTGMVIIIAVYLVLGVFLMAFIPILLAQAELDGQTIYISSEEFNPYIFWLIYTIIFFLFIGLLRFYAQYYKFSSTSKPKKQSFAAVDGVKSDGLFRDLFVTLFELLNAIFMEIFFTHNILGSGEVPLAAQTMIMASDGIDEAEMAVLASLKGKKNLQKVLKTLISLELLEKKWLKPTDDLRTYILTKKGQRLLEQAGLGERG